MTPRNADPMAAEVLSPDRTALLIVDVQNDFCDAQGAFGRLGLDLGLIQSSVRTLAGFIPAARQAGVPVIFIRTQHFKWTNSDVWLTRGGGHAAEICLPGGWGAQLYHVVAHPGDPEVVKHRYDAFLGTDLEMILRALDRRTILVTGAATNVCVETTARGAFVRDYHVVVVEDCCGALTMAEHNSALHNIRSYFGRVLDSLTITAHWQSLHSRQPDGETSSMAGAPRPQP